MSPSASGWVGSLCITVTISFMVYSHCMGLGAGSGLMGSITLHRNVHTGPYTDCDVKIFRRFLLMSTPNCPIRWYRLRSPNSSVWTPADRKCSRNTPREFHLGRENDLPTGWTFLQLYFAEEFHLVTLAHQRRTISFAHCYWLYRNLWCDTNNFTESCGHWS